MRSLVADFLDGWCGCHIGQGFQNRLHRAAGKGVHIQGGQVGQVAHLRQLGQRFLRGCMSLLAPALGMQSQGHACGVLLYGAVECMPILQLSSLAQLQSAEGALPGMHCRPLISTARCEVNPNSYLIITHVGCCMHVTSTACALGTMGIHHQLQQIPEVLPDRHEGC